jgi:hypothetical protein
MADHDSLRTRLEGRAERLEASALRTRSLVLALEAWRWRASLRRLSEALEAAAREEPQVAEALAFVLARREPEAWPEGPVLAAVEELLAWRRRLGEAVRRRLGSAATGEPEADLRRLLAGALTETRSARRWAEVGAVLAAEPALVAAAGHFGTELQRLFDGAGGPLLPLRPEDAAALEVAWGTGCEALARARAMLERADPTGALGRSLRQRARTPLAIGRGAPGAEAVAHAERWRLRAEALLAAALAPALLPTRPAAAELAPLAAWLSRRRRGLAAALPLPAPRAALLELAVALGEPGPPAWERLEALAMAADADPADPDRRRLLRALAARGVEAARAPWVPPVDREAVAPEPRSLPDDAPLLALVQRLAGRC